MENFHLSFFFFKQLEQQCKYGVNRYEKVYSSSRGGQDDMKAKKKNTQVHFQIMIQKLNGYIVQKIVLGGGGETI